MGRTKNYLSGLTLARNPAYPGTEDFGKELLLSAITTTPSWQWPADILVFAAQHQIDSYLQPLLQATRDLFPQARSIKVFLESDPEISDDWHVIYEVIVPQGYVSDYLRAQRSWTAELFRLCPKPLVCWFRLTLLPDET